MATEDESSQPDPETESLDLGETHMRTKRVLGAAAAAAVAVIAPLSTAIASAADVTGVGTGTIGATVLQVDVGEGGSVLSVRVLGDDGTSTTDPANGSPSSSTSLSPLTISSQTVPALNLSVPAVTTSSTGAEDSKSVSESPAVPALTGSIGASLSSVVDSVGARSGLDATLSNVGVAGGLLSVPSAAVNLATKATGTNASATRTISIPSIEVLNLGAVLEAVGLPLEALPLDDLLALLAGLGISVPDVADPAAVVDAVNDAIDSVQGQTGPLTAEICSTVDGALGEVGDLVDVGGVGDTVDDVVDDVDDAVGDAPIGGSDDVDDVLDDPLGTLSAQQVAVSCASLTGTVEDLVDELQTVVSDLLGSVLSLLDDTSLLSVSGIEVGLVADATESVDSSVATVTGTIGEVKVGALSVPGVSGLDLTAATDVLNGAADTITSAVGSVLGTINADLAGLVDVDVLDIVESVTTEGGYTKALASVTALTATIDPTGLLGASFAATDPVSAVLDEVGGTVPALSPVMAELEAALGGLDILTSPSTITVGRLSSSSSFRALAAGETPPTIGTSGELPRTGTEAALPAMAAVLVAGVALGVRRFVLNLAE